MCFFAFFALLRRLMISWKYQVTKCQLEKIIKYFFELTLLLLVGYGKGCMWGAQLSIQIRFCGVGCWVLCPSVALKMLLHGWVTLKQDILKY